MASVDLTGLPIRSASPALVDFGGMITPALGGPVQRIDRLGSRWAWTFETRPMAIEPDGRRWAALYALAKKNGALIPVKQPNLPIGSPGNTVVTTNTAAGKVVPVSGGAPGYPVRQGQWLSIVRAGQRYLDMVAADVALDLGGGNFVSIVNLLRTPIVTGDAVELAAPKIEGWIDGPASWPLESSRLTAFTFTVVEAA